MCFKQDGAISSLNGKPLKLIDQFRYFGSNISARESDVNVDIGKALTASDSLSIIWKFYPSDNIKRKFFQTQTKHLEKKLDGNYTRMLRAVWNKSWKQHPTKRQNMLDTDGK